MTEIGSLAYKSYFTLPHILLDETTGKGFSPRFIGMYDREYGDMIVTSGVQLSKFFDTVFNFGIFRLFGMPYFLEFIKTIPVEEMVSISVPDGAGLFDLIGVIFSGWLPMLTWLYVSVDSIIDLIFFFILFSAAFAVLGEDVKNAKWYAFGLAWIPVILYCYYVSNPFQEFPGALVAVQEIFYFWGHADGITLFMFFGTLIVSFVIVMEVIALIMFLLLKGATTTLQPGWATKEWSISQHGIAFGYTTAFMVMYFMHDYEWFIFFPFLILYSLLKKVGGVAIETANAHAEKNEIKELIAGIGNNGETIPIKSSSSGKSNSIEVILIVGILVIIVVILINNGIIKL